MKAIFMVFILSLITPLAFSSERVWTTEGVEHPLWAALNVEAIQVGFAEDGLVYKKEVAGISCDKTDVSTSDKEERYAYDCYFPKHLTAKQVISFYKAINSKEIGTSGAFTEIKVVDKLIVVINTDKYNEYNNSRIYLEHPCQKVTSEPTAQDCMDFWGKEVLPSFELDNVVQTLLATEERKELAKKVLKWDGYSSKYTKKIDNADYIGMMAEYQDELRFYYFSLKNGTNVIPDDVMYYNITNLEYSPLGKLVKKTPSDQIQDLIDEVVDAFFLGSDPSFFPYVKDDLQENIEYINEDE